VKVTFEIDPGLYVRAENSAQSQQISLDRIVSDALQKSITPPIHYEPDSVTALEQHNRFWVFEERNAIPVTVDHVRDILNENEGGGSAIL
jgi:hypothetical protein